MAFADIADQAQPQVMAFATVALRNLSTGNTETLYLSEGWTDTEKVDGSIHDWEGRITGRGHIVNPPPPIGQARWAYPRARLPIHVGQHGGNEADSFWDYLDASAYLWEGSEVKIWFVDLGQDYTSSSVNGVSLKFWGKVRSEPDHPEEGGTFTLDLIHRHFQEALPNRRTAYATDSGCGFVQPVCCNQSSSNQLFAGVNATAVDLIPSNGAAKDITGFAAGQVVAVCDAITGANMELVYVESVTTTPGSQKITVIRGYNGTTAVSHSANDPICAMVPGPNDRLQTGNEGLLLPYVFGGGVADRNPVLDVTPYAVARQFRIYSVGAPWPHVEFWFCAGKGAAVTEVWAVSSAGSSSQGMPTIYNDLDSVNGTALSWGTAIGASDNYHLEPHPVLTGSYWDINGWPDLSVYSYYALVKGLTHDELTSGNAHRYPPGIMAYVLQNSDWALGYTLSDVVYSGRITGWNSGGWIDEYNHATSEPWAAQVAAIVPQWGGGTSVYVMDFLQELADYVNADQFVREGKLYPKRRTVAGTADLTVYTPHWVEQPRKARAQDWGALYTNEMTAEFSGSTLYSEGDTPTGDPPIEVPHSVILQDYDEIDTRGGDPTGRIPAVIRRTWVYGNFGADFTKKKFSDPYGPQGAHLDHFRDAHAEQFACRAQPQMWIEAKLTPDCAWLEQGHTIEFSDGPWSVAPKGQVRGLVFEFGGGQPIVTTSTSWHINFPS